jgi:hypothetical protein
MVASRRIAMAGISLLLVAGSLPDPGLAAGGLVYGSITKFAAGGSDGPPPAPGTYRDDYQAAATPADPGSSTKMPFGFGKMLAKAQGAMAIFKSGVAEKHYIGTRKERVDSVSAQTADITDCSARTITHLDLAKRRYSVTSLDHPVTTSTAPAAHRDAPGPSPSDDGTKVAMTMSTRALGPMTIEGIATNGYDTTITMTATKADGETSTTDMKMTAYYAPFDEPHFACGDVGSMSAGSPGGASMANYEMMMGALRNAKSASSRFSVTSSGPPLPANRLAMWQDVTMSGAAGSHDRGSHGGAGFGVIVERGDVHAPLSDSDPAFGIPAGFTKIES